MYKEPFMLAFENTDWIVDDYGMRSKMLTGRFDIPVERLCEVQAFPSGKLLFWPTHLAKESWVNLESFVEAYKSALLAHRDRYPAAVPATLLEASVSMARRIAVCRAVTKQAPIRSALVAIGTAPRSLASRMMLPVAIALALCAVAPGAAVGQSKPAAVPSNAHAKAYGKGWECDRGYRESAGACAAVVVPDNAYADNFSQGRGWECNFGYRIRDNVCIAVKVPTNGYLADSYHGAGWQCERGYREVGADCIAIDVPEHGYLDGATYGPGWACDRGFRAEGEGCKAVEVPANGYMTNLPHGVGWACHRGYQAMGKTCAAIAVPANGHLTDEEFGSGWECDRGYQARAGTCAKMVVPANAHIGFLGNDWDCDRPFRKVDNTCVVE
jgi:hypothetical protein